MTSFNRVAFSGATDTINVPFGYLDKSHVKVLLNGTALSSTGYTWPTDGQVKITAGNPSAGTIGEVRRVTPEGPLVHFEAGNLDPNDMNTASLQPLYVAVEARDNVEGAQDYSDAAAASAAAARASESAAQSSADAAAAAVAEAESVIANGVTAVSVANKAAVRALDTSKKFAALVYGEGDANGTWRWRTGDWSALVTVDTLYGCVMPSNANPTGSLGAWVRDLSEGLKPEHFEAVGDASTDDTAALVAMAAVANNRPLLPITLSKIYRKTAVLAFTSETFVMRGIGAGSGFINTNCDGFTLTQTFRWASVKIADFINLTDQVNTKTGFVYNNTTAVTVTDGVVTRSVEAISSMGYGRWTNFASGSQGWLKDFSITNGDGFHFKDCVAWGDNNELAINNPFPQETYAYYTNAGTDVVFENCQACIRKYGVYGTGQSESNKVQGGDYIECYNCIDYSTVVSPSNDTSCIDVDLYFYHVGIDLGSAMGATHELTMATISGCLLFWASNVLGAGSMSAQYIRVNGYGNQITGNYFYCADNTAGAYQTICVNLYAGNDGFSPPIGNTIIGNVFYHQYKALNNQATVQGTVFAGNTFIDDPTDLTTSGVNPVTNNSSYPIYYGQNFGDRANYCDYTFFNDSGQTFGTKSGKGFAVTNVAGTAVNYPDVIPAVAGSPPQIRARGSDTNVDLKLTPQGTGNVTTSAAFRTGGNSADPAFLQSVGVTLNSGGLVSAFAAAGESLHLGTATGNKVAQFGYGGAVVGSIGIGASSVTYNTTSDRRLKENIAALDTDAAKTFINALQPRTFTMSGIAMAGFVADEFQAVSPASVTGEPDATDKDGKPIYQSMQASTAEVIANVVSTLQALIADVAALKAAVRT